MKKLFLTAIAVLLAVLAIAQNPMEQPVPMDPTVRYGKLDNGLTYYIRHNEKPAQRCEFHIAQAVGAILEEDNQNGLAHFLEHMCFNGTAHFPDKKIINYFESVGVSFGGDINAYTSLDETVYRLSNVPTTREGILDSALLVMYDWSCAVSLLGEEIDNERGVIREEWRTGNTASRRMWKNWMMMMMPNTQYAKRDVIGDTAVINNFTYQALRDYYNKWYGPDLQAIVVVGDIDVDKMEQKIINLFSGVKGRTGMTPRTRYGANDNETPDLGVYLDKEAQYQRITIGYKFPTDPDEVKLSMAGYVNDFVIDIMNSAINNRFNELSQDPKAPFTSMYGDFDNLAGTTDAMMFMVQPKDGKELEAYKALVYQIEKLRRYGITETELERVKADVMKNIESQYNERNNRQNQSWAQSCYRHYLDHSGRALTAPEFDKQMAEQLMPMITTAMINPTIAQLISGKNMFINALGKDNEECKMPTTKVLAAEYAAAAALIIEAPKEDKIDRPLVENEPAPGAIVKTKEVAALGVTELYLSNGIKVVVKKTDFKSDEINMQALSYGGYSRCKKIDDMLNAQIATAIVEYNGVGTFNKTDLQKVLAGKDVWVSPSIDRFTESMEGSSSIKDFGTLLMLNYLYFTAPRKDDNQFKTLMGLLENSLKSRDVNPKTEYSDRINKTLYANNERIFPFTTELLPKINQKKALKLYQERFANPADFTFYFVGNIDINDPATKALIEKWVGGLKTSKKMEKADYDDGVHYAKGGNYEYFKKDMKTKTASNRVYILGNGFEYTLKNRIAIDLIGSILSTRYLESIREREGGSYGVGTYGFMDRRPQPTMLLLMNFDTDPDKQNHLLNIIYEEVETIIKDGPLATDLNKEKENLLKVYDQKIKENGYWMNTVLMSYYNNKGLNYLEEYKKTVESIDGKFIQKLLKEIYEQGNIVEVVMMPTRK